jgi:hypothetical protein
VFAENAVEGVVMDYSTRWIRVAVPAEAAWQVRGGSWRLDQYSNTTAHERRVPSLRTLHLRCPTTVPSLQGITGTDLRQIPHFLNPLNRTRRLSRKPQALLTGFIWPQSYVSNPLLLGFRVASSICKPCGLPHTFARWVRPVLVLLCFRLSGKQGAVAGRKIKKTNKCRQIK